MASPPGAGTKGSGRSQGPSVGNRGAGDDPGLNGRDLPVFDVEELVVAFRLGREIGLPIPDLSPSVDTHDRDLLAEVDRSESTQFLVDDEPTGFVQIQIVR